MGCPCRDLDVPPRAKPLRGWPPSTPRLPESLHYRQGTRELLLRWPELREVVPEAFRKLTDSFGASAQIVLDRFDDPEAEEEGPILYLVVRTDLEADAAREALDRLDEWWLMNEERANGRLQISLEFL
jgi:hypothetical protein